MINTKHRILMGKQGSINSIGNDVKSLITLVEPLMQKDKIEEAEVT